MALTAQPSRAPYYLVLGQGYDRRWKASMDGRSLGRPIVVDGYSVAWRITDTGPHRFQVDFGPQRPLSFSLALSLIGLALVVGLLIVGRRTT
jgi:arabinofuranan 3-O-arabinosyltransferase